VTENWPYAAFEGLTMVYKCGHFWQNLTSGQKMPLASKIHRRNTGQTRTRP